MLTKPVAIVLIEHTVWPNNVVITLHREAVLTRNGCRAYLTRVLQDKWSPEAAVGRLCDETDLRVSVQTVYHWLRRDGYDARHKVVVKRYRRRNQ